MQSRQESGRRCGLYTHTHTHLCFCSSFDQASVVSQKNPPLRDLGVARANYLECSRVRNWDRALAYVQGPGFHP